MARYESESNYYGDSRVRGRDNRWYDSISSDKRKALVTVHNYDDDEDIEEQVEVNIEWEVCPTCGGRGSHVNPSIDCNGLSAEDFHDDPDFAESYFSGAYDVPCYECGGKNVVPVCLDEKVNEYLHEEAQARAEMRAEYLAERRMGC